MVKTEERIVFRSNSNPKPNSVDGKNETYNCIVPLGCYYRMFKAVDVKLQSMVVLSHSGTIPKYPTDVQNSTLKFVSHKLRGSTTAGIEALLYTRPMVGLERMREVEHRTGLYTFQLLLYNVQNSFLHNCISNAGPSTFREIH
jgi:hypothetical protein